MSQLLGTQLDKETLATCIGMIESGVNPEALAVSIQFSPLILGTNSSTSGCDSRIEERERSHWCEAIPRRGMIRLVSVVYVA
jgi:hypothetical protein